MSLVNYPEYNYSYALSSCDVRGALGQFAISSFNAMIRLFRFDMRSLHVADVYHGQ